MQEALALENISKITKLLELHKTYYKKRDFSLMYKQPASSNGLSKERRKAD